MRVYNDSEVVEGTLSVELLLILLGVPATIATAYFSLSDEKNQRRKWYRAAALALAILNVVAAIEVYYQSENVQRLSANVDRRWTVATHLPIDHLEFELLFPDGAVPVGDVSGALSLATLEFDGLAVLENNDSGDPVPIGGLLMVPNPTRTGVPRSRIRTTSNGDSTIEDTQCVASSFLGATIKLVGEGSENRLICSITQAVPVVEGLTVADLAKARSVSLVLPASSVPLHCFGPCTGMHLGVRAVVNAESGPLLPEMIELSPVSQLGVPSRIADDGVTFAVAGSALLELARQRFAASFGYKDIVPFKHTLGAVWSVFQLLTGRSYEGSIVGLVWTTDSTPPEESLIGAVGGNADRLLEPMFLREWCGLGEGETCWHVFAVFAPTGAS